jgi:hypothetical protein
MRKLMSVGLTKSAFVSAIVCAVVCSGLSTSAYAQSPAPNRSFYSENPPYLVTGHNGYVVETVDYGCGGPSLSQVESDTGYYISNHDYVWTEITPYTVTGCNTIPMIESFITSMINYVESTFPSIAGTYWQGIMLDEEPQYIVSSGSQATTAYNTLESLNNWTFNTIVSGGTGLTWWANEIANYPGWWTQTQYDSLMTNSIPAPQIYNSNMVTYANASGAYYTEVTWMPSASYPFDSQSYATGQINGSAYPIYNGSSYTYWCNEFV